MKLTGKIFKSILFSAGICFCLISPAFSQCTTLGQNPSSAFPICGGQVFTQTSVPICQGQSLFVPGCSGTGGLYENKNPFYYKFTCYIAGPLNFTITPLAPMEDYDWQLYDITGTTPDAIFTNNNLVVTGNWAGTYGPTGASASGVPGIECASDPAANRPTFARSPNLITGHEYLLLISHFTDTQSGYTINFGSSSSLITDPLDPHFKSASAPCDGTEIRVIMNKKMKCSSIAADGSDFRITLGASVFTPVAAAAQSCLTGFDADTVSITMPGPLVPGTYRVVAKNGTDGNTVKDACDREVPVNEFVEFTVFPLFPTPLDSVTRPGCAPDKLVLVFAKQIKCSSVEPSGSDFNISGPYPVSITSASMDCTGGKSNKITLTLSAPMQTAGNFQVNLQTGTDGNTIFDECDMQTPLPDFAGFIVADTVNADFTYNINYSCTGNVVDFAHNGANNVNRWTWSFSNGLQSSLQNPSLNFGLIPDVTANLMVSNGTCRDTSAQKIVFDNYLNADFTVSPLICPEDRAVFVNNSVGTIVNWNWQFGNGQTSPIKNPPPQAYTPLEANDYDAVPQLIITNNYGCSDTASQKIKVVYSCFIAVPNAFTPNNDGRNDFLYPLKAYKSKDLRFAVYNRLGQRVFLGTEWTQKWNGMVGGLPQDAGTYVWTLDYTLTDTGKRVSLKGTTILIR